MGYVNWKKEKTSIATFKSFQSDDRTLYVFIHEQPNPIKCTSNHKGDFLNAINTVKVMADGDKFKYRSRGIDTYSPTEWFFKIEPLPIPDLAVSRSSANDILSSEAETLELQKSSRLAVPSFAEDEKTSQKVYGPPGTGKTRRMMDIIRERLSEGVIPDEICFISYTNVAANEATDRVSKAIPDYDATDFHYFKTIHALATMLGGLDGKTVMSSKDMENFDKTILSKPVWTEKGKAESIKVRNEHPCLTLMSLASARKTSYLDQMQYVDELMESVLRSCRINNWFHPTFSSEVSAVQFWMRAYQRFKDENNFVDYDDVIRKVLTSDFDRANLRFKLLIIDEAQDCSDFMWDFLKLMIKESKEVYICGDDDQAIMDGFGANSQAFLEIETTENDLVLTKSWRLSESHHKNLLSPGGALDILKLHKTKRKEKIFTHNGDQKGQITSELTNAKNEKVKLTLEHLIRIVQQQKEQDWLIMAPTRNSVDEISTALLFKGLSHYKNNEPQYIGDSMEVFDIRVQTIHTSKGAEANNVGIVILTKGDYGMYIDPTSERFNPTLRYVAESRSKQNLFIVRKF